MPNERPQTPKEVDIFNRFSGRTNKLKVIAITLAIALVIFGVTYIFAKSLMTYYVSYETYGGMVFGKELEPTPYKLFQKTKRPENLRKSGFYIEKYCTDKNLQKEYTFGSAVWRGFKLYVDWQPGKAVILNFAEGEENEDLSLAELKLYYEEYVKPGSMYTIPLVYNLNEKSEHYGEQLLFFMEEDCSDKPFWDKTFEVTEDINIYGKWFDTKDEKFVIDDNGTLLSYSGKCDNVVIPSSVTKIKDCTAIESGYYPAYQALISDRYSVWHNRKTSLKSVYAKDSLLEFGDYSFATCSALERVDFLGDGLNRIGDNAFQFCYNLKYFKFPSKVKVIGSNTFEGAGKDVDGGLVLFDTNNIEEIQDCAFINSSVKKLTFKSLKTVGKMCFAGTLLNSITLDTKQMVANTVTSEEEGYNGNNVLQMTVLTSSFKIYVPAELISQYQSAFGWRKYSKYFTPIVV
jgi:hypothetical protein